VEFFNESLPGNFFFEDFFILEIYFMVFFMNVLRISPENYLQKSSFNHLIQKHFEHFSSLIFRILPRSFSSGSLENMK